MRGRLPKTEDLPFVPKTAENPPLKTSMVSHKRKMKRKKKGVMGVEKKVGGDDPVIVATLLGLR